MKRRQSGCGNRRDSRADEQVKKVLRNLAQWQAAAPCPGYDQRRSSTPVAVEIATVEGPVPGNIARFTVRNITLFSLLAFLLLCAGCTASHDVEVVEAIQFLTHKKPNVRERAARDLGRLGDARAVGPLIGALGDEEARVRFAVVEALGGIGDTLAVAPLVAALEDPEAAVCLAAVEALIDFVTQPRNDFVRSYAVKSLGEIGNRRAVETLIPLLGDELMSVARNAAEALGAIGDVRAVDTLSAILLKDRAPYIRQAAAQALGRIGDSRAVDALVVALKDGETRGWEAQVREAAAEALGAIGDARSVTGAVPALKQALDAYGTLEMATAFLNCGHPELVYRARLWARTYGFPLLSRSGAGGVVWGER